MTDEQFWALIDRARIGTVASADPERLHKILNPLSDEAVLAFGQKFYEKVCDLNNWRLWAAGYVIAGGMSDDGFHYFRSWIVGKGKKVFDIAMKDPDELGTFIDDREVGNESLEYVAVEIAKARKIEQDPRDLADRSADDDPAGEPFKEETAGAGLPKLAALFG
jgi:Protein of unknown function (DUF4240)